MIPVTDRIRQSLVSLHMARALETLDQTLSQLERGEISAIEAIDALLAEELNLREGRRIGVALRTARLMPIKTLESFDFSFQPSLDRGRILALAQLDFIERGEQSGLPKYFEWYAAFGLLVTMVWLYLEILRLLAKLRDR